MSIEQRVRGRNVSSVELEAFGKTAARLSDTSGYSLTEAMVRTLENESLNAEQVRRAVEYCNIAAVNSKFASLRGDNRIVDIHGGPADPIAVIDALHAHASAPIAKLAALEYSAPPDLSYGARNKHAHAFERPAPDIKDLKRKLAAAHEELMNECTSSEFHMEMKLAELRDCAMAAAREGASLCDLTAAWSRVNPKIASVAAQQLRMDIHWGTKTASRSLNPEHRVVQKFAEFAKVALEHSRYVGARQNVEAQLGEVSGFLARQVS